MPGAVVLNPRRVLCLDDDLAIARMVADVVEYLGHEPVIETDSVRAVIQHVRGDFGAAIVDLLMPRVSGIDVLMAFSQSNPTVRRVLLTAAPTEREVADAVRDGTIQMLLVKPPMIGDLRAALAWL